MKLFQNQMVFPVFSTMPQILKTIGLVAHNFYVFLPFLLSLSLVFQFFNKSRTFSSSFIGFSSLGLQAKEVLTQHSPSPWSAGGCDRRVGSIFIKQEKKNHNTNYTPDLGF